jgi:sugar lactone lactonase YvrE
MHKGGGRTERLGGALLVSALVATTVAVVAPTTPPARAEEPGVTHASLGDGLDPGKIRYVAGTAGTTGFAGDGGPATEARFNSPNGLDFDSDGNLYVADLGNGRIRRIDAETKVITTVAGGGDWSSALGDGGPATSAFLYNPEDVAVGPGGDLYIVDSRNQRIRRVDAETGIITTFAGGGPTTGTGDGGPANQAYLRFPTSVSIGADGDVYIADANDQRVRKVDGATGIITTIAGTGVAGYGGDGGPATSAPLYSPWGVAVNAAGDVFIGDTGNYRVRRVDAATGIITTFAGGGTLGAAANGGPATAAQVIRPRGIAIDDAGNVFVAEEGNSTIRRIDAATGVIGAVAGGNGAYCPDSEWAVRSCILSPYGVAVGPGGLLAMDADTRLAVVAPDTAPDPVSNVGAQFFAAGCCSPDLFNVTWTLPARPVSRIIATASPGGASTSATGTQTSTSLTGLTRGEQYVVTVRSFNGWGFSTGASSAPTWFGTPPAAGTVAGVPAPPPGEIRVVAGTGVASFSGDGGPATGATLNRPSGLAWDAAGNLYIADRSNNRIRRVAASTGVISTIAGDGTLASSGDGGPAVSAQLYLPYAVAVAPDGDVVVAEFPNPRVRRIDVDTGVITTIAGTGIAGSSGDGGPATAARLQRPEHLAVTPDGAVLIADTGDNRVRRVDPVTGVITTFAGTGECATSGDGGPADHTPICQPAGLAIDQAGNVFVTDEWDRRVRRIDAGTNTVTTVARGTIDPFGGGFGDGLPATETRLNPAGHLGVDAAGNLFIVERSRDRIRRVDATTGLIGTVAGTGQRAAGNTSGPAIDSPFGLPLGLAVRPDGIFAVTTPDFTGGMTVRVVSPDGPPDAPSGASLSVVGTGTVRASWNPPDRPINAARVVLAPRGQTRLVERYQLPGPVDLFDVQGTVTATVAAFNGWGWSAPSAPSAPVDLGGDPEPRLFDQFDADATGTAAVNAFLLNLLANAVYKETWDPDHSARTDESWRELMAQRATEWGLTDLSFDITDTETGTQSIAVRTADALIVSFRGTEPNERADVITDAGVALVPVITPYGPVNVHTGFWSALDSVYPELLAIAQEVPGQPVWLTGHSLGGSLAALAAFRLALDGVTVGGVHTVGAPAVGDLALTLVYDIGLDLRERTQRWVNDHDIVPMAFDLLPGYVDLGTTNVFFRRSLDDPRDFDVVLDSLLQPYAAPGLDDHDDALYATRIWELIRRTDPAAAAALPEPEPPYLRPTGVDTQRAVRLLVIYFAGELDLLIAGLVEEAELTALEAAAMMREAEASFVLVARVLYDGYRLTTDQIVDILTDLGATAEEIAAALSALVDELVEQLRDGLSAISSTFVEWAAAFGFDGDASLVPPDLARLFDLESWLALFELPTIDPLAALDDALDALEAQGVTILTPTEDDLFRGEIVITIDDLGSIGDPTSPEAQEVLEGLADAMNLDGTGAWDGTLTLTLRFGVDSGGFYLSPESTLVLEVDGNVSITGTATVAGATAEITGTATADLVATAQPSGADRVRLGVTAPELSAALTGTVSTTLDADLGDVELMWAGTSDVSAAKGPGATGSASASLRAGATLGGTATLTFLDNGGTPAAVELQGVLEPGGWRITGGLSGELSAGAFAVTSASLDALLTATTFSGTGTLGAEVSLAGSGTITGELVIEWRPTGTTVSGTMSLDGVTAGALARFEGITLGFTATSSGVEISLSSEPGGRIVLFHDQQLLTIVEPSGTLSSDGTLTFSATSATGLIAGVVEIEMTDPEITLRRPGPTPSALLTLPSVVGTLPSLGGATVTFTGLQLMDDGTFRASSVAAEPADIAAALGIAGILPFQIDSVAIVFPDSQNLDRFDATVTGTFDHTALSALPFTPILTIGRADGTSSLVDVGESAQPFTFTVRADSFSTGQIRPVDLGPITIGFADLQAGPVTLGATITLGGYQDGEFQSTVGGSLSVLAEADGLSASADATLSGDLTLTDTGGVLDLAGMLTIGGSYQDVFELTGLALSARLRIVLDGAMLTMDELHLDDLTVEEISMRFGDLVRITARDVTIDLTPTFGSNLIVFGGDPTAPGASVEFVGTALEGWAGSAGNVALRYVEGDNGLPLIVPVLLPGFYADVTVGDSGIGLPDWLPFTVRAAGLTLPDVLTAPLPPDGLRLTTDVLKGLRVRVSGGMVATGSWPVTAEVEGLEIDLGLLTQTPAQFPITNLDAVMFGVEPFSIGPTTVGGGMGLGVIEVDVDPGPAKVIERVFFFRVFGEFSYSGFGAGLDLVLTQYGPVLASVTAPAPIPLGTSGLMLAGVRGGLQFGGDGLVPPSDPIELLDDRSPYQLEFPVDIDTITRAVRTCAEENYGRRGVPDATWPCFTWNDGGLLYLGATVTSYAAPGAVAANITGAIDLRFGPAGELPKLRLAAAGTVDVYGFKIARAGMLLALDDPLAPSFDMAMRMPDLSGPLGFMMGATGEFTIDLDTTGIAAGAIEATRILLAEIEDGAVTGGRQLLADALDELAASAELSRTLVHDDPAELERVAPYRRLAFELLDLNGDGDLSLTESARTIDRTFLVDRMLGRNGIPGLLPASYPTGARALDLLRTGRVPRVLAAFQTALLGEAQRLAEVSGRNYDLTALLADPTVTTYGVAGLAFLELMTQSVANGIASGAAAWGAVFDPTFVMEGAIQPMVLGVPFGEPTDKGTFFINRREIGFGLSASAESLALSVFGGLGVTAAELNKVFGPNTIVESFGTLPVPDVLGALAAGIRSDSTRSRPTGASRWRFTTKVAGFTLGDRTRAVDPTEERVGDARRALPSRRPERLAVHRRSHPRERPGALGRDLRPRWSRDHLGVEGAAFRHRPRRCARRAEAAAAGRPARVVRPDRAEPCSDHGRDDRRALAGLHPQLSRAARPALRHRPVVAHGSRRHDTVRRRVVRGGRGRRHRHLERRLRRRRVGCRAPRGAGRQRNDVRRRHRLPRRRELSAVRQPPPHVLVRRRHRDDWWCPGHPSRARCRCHGDQCEGRRGARRLRVTRLHLAQHTCDGSSPGLRHRLRPRVDESAPAFRRPADRRHPEPRRSGDRRPVRPRGAGRRSGHRRSVRHRVGCPDRSDRRCDHQRCDGHAPAGERHGHRVDRRERRHADRHGHSERHTERSARRHHPARALDRRHRPRRVRARCRATSRSQPRQRGHLDRRSHGRRHVQLPCTRDRQRRSDRRARPVGRRNGRHRRHDGLDRSGPTDERRDPAPPGSPREQDLSPLRGRDRHGARRRRSAHGVGLARPRRHRLPHGSQRHHPPRNAVGDSAHAHRCQRHTGPHRHGGTARARRHDDGARRLTLTQRSGDDRQHRDLGLPLR